MISEEDIRIELVPQLDASYMGTERAVRVTHIPTGISVTSDSERSQLANKAKAIYTLDRMLLEARVANLEERVTQGERMRTELWKLTTRAAILIAQHLGVPEEELEAEREKLKTIGFPAVNPHPPI